MQTVYNKRKSLQYHLCNWKMKKRVKTRKGRYNENKGITVLDKLYTAKRGLKRLSKRPEHNQNKLKLMLASDETDHRLCRHSLEC